MNASDSVIHVRTEYVTLIPDSVPADSTAVAEKTYGLTLQAPPETKTKIRRDDSTGMSFIFGGLALLFVVIGLRFRNNSKYVSAMLHSLVEVRLRNNVFDDTVRETFFLILLNLLWSACAGIMLWGFLVYNVGHDPVQSFGIPGLADNPSGTMGVCIGLGVAYTCLMSLAYLTVGTVFSDRQHARMWVKGFAASQGLMSIIFFPLSLLVVFYPEWAGILLQIALVTFLAAKIVFIWKGFRIFFTQISSWVLFLYYLCSLEIIPLILTYLAALLLCSLL